MDAFLDDWGKNPSEFRQILCFWDKTEVVDRTISARINDAIVLMFKV
jgi:hypothetical protein